jgi:uncharacterized repeat protein (TIGR01451 family)
MNYPETQPAFFVKRNIVNSAFMAIALLLLLSSPSYAQFSINETFKTNSSGNVTTGGSARLTSGIADPIGEGWLRLTPDSTNKVGYGYVNQSFPSNLGVLVDFEYVSWRRRADNYGGADGFSVFLFDAATPTFKIGGIGGSLGYAVNNGQSGTTGLAGGYVGIGLDEYGNYANPTEGRIGGPGFTPNAISLRGRAADNYPYITGTTLTAAQGNVDYDVIGATRPTVQQFYRRIQVEITPTGGSYSITMRWKTSATGQFVTIFGPTVLATPPPAALKLGFAATTGGGINNHEVRNVIITTPGNVRVTKTANKSSMKVGESIAYNVTVYNETPSALNGIVVDDTLRDGTGTTGALVSSAGFTVDSIKFNNNGFAGNTVTQAPALGHPFQAAINMQANSNATFMVYGRVNALPPGGLLRNQASIDPVPTGISDQDLTNNVSIVSTQVVSPDHTIEMSHTGNFNQCTNNTYTIVVANNGPQALTASTGTTTVTDTLPQGLSPVSASGTGWTTTIAGNVVTAVRYDELLLGASYPPLTIVTTMAAGAPSAITNKATVSNPLDVNTSNNTAADATTLIATPVANAGQDHAGTEVVYNMNGNVPDAGVNGTWTIGSVSPANAVVLISDIHNPSATVTFPFNATVRMVWSLTNGTCASTDTMVLSNIMPLPVQLSSFNAEAYQNTALLKWVTSSEINNRGFEIERSTDGRNFTAIGFESTKAVDGNSSTALDYSFVDYTPFSGTNFYRLRQTDVDGRSSYSNIAKVNFNAAENNIVLYPNPASGMVYISNMPAGAKLYFMSSLGQVLFTTEKNAADISMLAPGTYYVRTDMKEAKVIKFIKE